MAGQQIILAAALVAYFALHSLIASLWMKQKVAERWPQAMPFYRLAFNGVAIVLAVPLFLYVFFNPGELLWQWRGIGFFIANGLALLAIVGFIASLRSYDMAEFWGTRQLQENSREIKDLENFHLSPFHRFVRHPWYFFLLVILWTRDMYTTQFVAYLMITLYVALGSWLEEKKLIHYHGEIYSRYRKLVPGLIPLPWKFMTRRQAVALLADNRDIDR